MATDRSFGNMLKTEKPLSDKPKRKSIWESVLKALQAKQANISNMSIEDMMAVVNDQKAKRRG